MKKIAVTFALVLVAAIMVVPIVTPGNSSPSNSGVEGNVVRTFIADGSPRPPVPPIVLSDGSPRPPVPPMTFDGSPRPPVPPGLSA